MIKKCDCSISGSRACLSCTNYLEGISHPTDDACNGVRKDEKRVEIPKLFKEDQYTDEWHYRHSFGKDKEGNEIWDIPQ